jgi:Raf kinase inhibitor-like YbhB/YbcL family protein
MNITSPAFQNNANISAKYTCDGDDVNPPLEFHDIPGNCVSLALIVDDPDAPSGDFVHWIIWNIVPTVGGIGENSVPEGGTEGMTDFGRGGWGGPCPPSGVHRYHFKLFALDTLLEIPADSTKVDLEASMSGHILEQAVYIGKYQRQIK